MAVDEGAFAAWHIPTSTSWKWVPINNCDKIIYLEAGTRIDEILISGEKNYVMIATVSVTIA